jgi:hypothetical protein
LSYKEGQRRYGIQGRSTVLVCLRKHGRQDWSVRRAPRRKGVGMKSSSELPLTPEQRIKELEVQLQRANEKAQLFEAMLDVIKKDFGVQTHSTGNLSAATRFRHRPRYATIPQGTDCAGRDANRGLWSRERTDLDALEYCQGHAPISAAAIWTVGENYLLRMDRVAGVAGFSRCFRPGRHVSSPGKSSTTVRSISSEHAAMPIRMADETDLSEIRSLLCE